MDNGRAVRGTYDTAGNAILGEEYLGMPALDGDSVKFAKLASTAP